MDTKTIIEIFGYVGSVLVVVSMLMSNIVKLRIINTAGSIISGIYAVICGALPLALMNICLIIINVTQMYKLIKTKQSYDLVEGEGSDSMVAYFLNRYQDDIKQFFPGFNKEAATGQKAWLVCCEGNPSGVMLGTVSGDKIDIILDYTTPAYRDCSVGKFLYASLPEKNIRTLEFGQQLSDTNADYLKKMGFVNANGVFTKKL